ncbi:hypothetical protein P3T35_001366 [Kitasatospora sp. GP30]|uniref:DUF3995 domain-containing protein n=1 Tax=Kitasatospora sp. GP30 TaxID=3035084 RepID=UPI000C711511|nr:DUF3995 domain-containing protein [Kitasatospora sp. GP30]MDH6139366.1 hypothetical protein [Kitasatospora sp. GP30]
MPIKHHVGEAVHPVPHGATGLPPGKWAGYVVAVWGVLFAIPSFVWAMGGTFGAQSTVAPELVKMAEDGVPWFLALLWVTGFLKLYAALVGVGLTRRQDGWISRLVVFSAGGATVLLVCHGSMFVVHGILAEIGAIDVRPDIAGLTHWYLYLWGPYFVTGGLAFGAALLRYLRRHDTRQVIRRYAAVGALGAGLLSLASIITGIG